MNLGNTTHFSAPAEAPNLKGSPVVRGALEDLVAGWTEHWLSSSSVTMEMSLDLSEPWSPWIKRLSLETKGWFSI